MKHHSDFVHLHVHSEYSLLDGAAHLEKLVDKAKELRFPALALTDHGNLFGAVDFYTACTKSGVKPILGCELYVAPGSRFERSSQDGGYEGASHCTVLARTAAGYANLMKLVSKAYLEGYYYKPRVDRELLAQHARGDQRAAARPNWAASNRRHPDRACHAIPEYLGQNQGAL